MKRLLAAMMLVALWPCACPAEDGGKAALPSANIPNPAIDYDKFARNVSEVGRLRESRRITEERFLEMAADPE